MTLSAVGRQLVIGKIRVLCATLSECWALPAILGVIMAILSFSIDTCIDYLQQWHMDLFHMTDSLPTAVNFRSYITWTGYTVILVIIAAYFVHFVAPQAIGSGIPEIKTIMRGTKLDEYLSARVLISKVVGLTLSLGAGLPIGNEGPFVHVSAIVATITERFLPEYKKYASSLYDQRELLATACAVGVSSTFGAPFGGVLFSIEVTSAQFAVRNYWRAFFAVACSCTVLDGLHVLRKYSTGKVLCGLGGALFIALHRKATLFCRNNQYLKKINETSFIIIPVFVSICVATLTYPAGYGKLVAGQLRLKHVIGDLFHNCTFSANKTSVHHCQNNLVNDWTSNDEISVFVILSAFICTFYCLTIVCNTLPIPAGLFVPVFVIGAAFGRLCGEIVAVVHQNNHSAKYGALIDIYPGAYAVICAAAFCGSVTQTVSIIVITFELTGQIKVMLPILVAVLIANVVCTNLQPSIYNSMIMIKGLPKVPHLRLLSSIYHDVQALDIMTSDVKYISKDTTFKELSELLDSIPDVYEVPLVSDRETKVLIGCVKSIHLWDIFENHMRPAHATTSSMKSKRSTAKFSLNSFTSLSQFHIDTNTDENREKLNARITLDEEHVHPSPFQVVGHTSLYQMNLLYHQFAIRRAYVTHLGQLIGVISDGELRRALRRQ